MITANPKISVLLPVYNGQPYLRQAVESVLNQTFANFELLIIDDGSTDQSRTVVNQFSDPRIKIIINPVNQGLTHVLNLGLRIAQGEYIARMDADDICRHQRLEKQLNFMQNNPEVALVGSWAEIIDDRDKIIGYRRPPIDPQILKFNLLFFNPLIHSSIFFRKEAVAKAGGYNESYKRAQDYELYSRLIRRNTLAVIPEHLLRYREHKYSVTKSPQTKEVAQNSALQIVRQNWENYLALSDSVFIALSKTLFLKGRYPNLRESATSWVWLRKLFTSYAKKEQLSASQKKKIRPLYRCFQKGLLKKVFR